MRVLPAKSRFSISQCLTTVLTFGLFMYFAYHLVHGDRGYFAWKGLQEKLAFNETKYDHKLEERMGLENRVKRLRPDSLDLDVLDERARIVLGFVRPDERVVITSN
jgi:cell division protein FtsB